MYFIWRSAKASLNIYVLKNVNKSTNKLIHRFEYVNERNLWQSYARHDVQHSAAYHAAVPPRHADVRC